MLPLLRLPVLALVCLTVTSCGVAPPACGDKEVLAVVTKLLSQNAEAILLKRVPQNDLLLRISLIGLVAEKKLEWGLQSARTTALDEKIGARTCALEVSYGADGKVTGSFSLGYRINRTDDGGLYVSFID
jgi:hypothetical protein